MTLKVTWLWVGGRRQGLWPLRDGAQAGGSRGLAGARRARVTACGPGDAGRGDGDGPGRRLSGSGRVRV